MTSTSSNSSNAGSSDSNRDINTAEGVAKTNKNRISISATASSDGDSNNDSTAAALLHNNIELEYNRIANDRNGWQRLYQEIREKCEREANEKHFGTSESEKPHNRCLNRYRDVNPYDHSRIIIHRGSVDYINANLVKLERAERKYILTQGPLGDTVGHFWLMIWEQNTKAILMLNKLMEKKQIKCHMYWPERKGSECALKLDEVNLMVEFLRCERYKNFCRRWLKLTDLETNQSREILQFHYTTWPDFGIPSSPVAFLQFLKEVRDSGALDTNVGPAVVHCSAGIGRSGTFCLVDCCLVLIDKEGVNNVSVQNVLYELRRYRMGLIQTADQLYFSYQAIIEGIKLLKDPEFLNYKEASIIASEDTLSRQDQCNLDEIPPPLPPRTHSLLPINDAEGPFDLRALAHSKPLPKIPASVSFNDDLYASENNIKKDALNNFINNERNTESMSNRPLPPLPKHHQNSLHRVREFDSDDNEFFEDNDNSEEDDIVDEDEEKCDADANDKNTNEVNRNDSNRSQNNHKDQANDNDLIKLNGLESTSSANLSPENEVRRRKRAERQANIEQKVNEIKRKQRENEESKQTAKKRRDGKKRN